MPFKLQQLTGELIYLHDHDQGRLQIHSNNQYQWLSLDQAVHSIMDKQHPQKLVFPHQQAMALSFYLRPQAQQLLELGLGGGSLIRYVQQWPEISLTTVELNPAIINCFWQYFNPGRIDADIVQADANEYLQHCHQQDLIYVDLFGTDGCPAFLHQPEFYQLLLNSLNDEGLCCINFISASVLEREWLSDLLSGLFGQPPLIFDVPGYNNHIIMASRSALPDLRRCDDVWEFARQQQLELTAINQIRP